MMFITAQKADSTAKQKLEQFLDILFEEITQVVDHNEELNMMSAYFMGQEALTKGTFIVCSDVDLPKKFIIVPGIPYEISANWAY